MIHLTAASTIGDLPVDREYREFSGGSDEAALTFRKWAKANTVIRYWNA
jgi:hypothetical protein